MATAKRTSPSKTRRPKRGPAPVVDLAFFRTARRREIAQRRVQAVLDENRLALSRLFTTGLLFSQKGSRAGRELLLAHQALLRVADVLARLTEHGSGDDLGLRVRGEEVLSRLDSLLARSSQLTARTGEFLAGRSRE